MFKKMVVLLAAAMLTVAAAAPAMAAFADNNDLIRVVYNAAGTQEVYTDLGNITTALANPASIATSSFITGQTGSAGAGTLNAGSLFANTAMANLNVAYFTINTANTGYNYVSGTAVVPNLGDPTQYVNAVSSFQAYLKGLTVTNGNAVGTSGGYGSYATLFQQGSNSGLMGGLTDISIDQNLASLASGGTLTTKLYYFADNTSSAAALVPLTLNLDSTGVTGGVAPTPIPPSFLLMGSGLLGMVGIRRKFNA